MAQSILDIVTKNIEKPHIADNMHKTSVKKHEGNKCKSLLAESEVCGNLRNRVSCRYKTIYVSEAIKVLSLGNLNQKTDYIDGNERVRNNRIIFRWYGVSNWKHLMLF